MKLLPKEGKVTRFGIERRDDRFTNWASTEVKVFWDVQFVNTGELKIGLAIGNDKYSANAKIHCFVTQCGTEHTMIGTTTNSGGYDKPKVMPMGEATIFETGKVKITFQVLHLVDDFPVGNLFYVDLSGPASVGAKAVDIYPFVAEQIVLYYSETDIGCTMLYSDVIMNESYPGTYAAACGFTNSGYVGIQENNFKGRKVTIFSVWDQKDQEEERLPGEEPGQHELCTCVRQGEGFELVRFGNEGTGMSLRCNIPWKIGEKIHFLVKIDKADEHNAIFTAFVYSNAKKQWKLIGALKRAKKLMLMQGFYSFLEDYWRICGHVAKECSFNPWARLASGEWHQPKAGNFTKTGVNMNVNAWGSDERFYFRIGRDTVMTVNENRRVERKPDNKLPSVLENIEEIIREERYLP